MISFSIYLCHRQADRKINGEDGLSHSEIAGSKLAHSSPTLIAACHVLHRLYMPRHSPDALTSRLRVHTTNDSTGTAPSPIGADDKSQPDNICVQHRSDTKPDRVATASIKKTHSQCQREAKASYPHTRCGNPFLHSWSDTTRRSKAGGAYRDRTDDLMLAKQPLSQLS